MSIHAEPGGCLRVVPESAATGRNRRLFLPFADVDVAADVMTSFILGRVLMLVADFDAENIRDGRGRVAARKTASMLRAGGWEYDARRKCVRCVGLRRLEVTAAYLGADDTVGPGYTGQLAVTSHYDWSLT